MTALLEINFGEFPALALFTMDLACSGHCCLMVNPLESRDTSEEKAYRVASLLHQRQFSSAPTNHAGALGAGPSGLSCMHL